MRGNDFIDKSFIRIFRQRKTVLIFFLAVFLLDSILVSSFQPADAAKGTTGTASVPGTGESIEYKIEVVKVPGSNKVHLKLTADNPSDKELNFIACGMIQIKGSASPVPSTEISLEEVNGTKTWVCKDKRIDDVRPKSFHFGCKIIKIPANAKGHVIFDEDSKELPLPAPEKLEEEDLKSIYWDLLELHPIAPGCNKFLGQQVNVNLGPATGDIVDNSANVWGGSIFGGRCGESLCYVGRWEVGNWVTMDIPGEYASVMVGTLSGAPSNALVTLEIPDRLAREYTTSSTGQLTIEESFIITQAEEEMILSIFADSGPQQGNEIRFDAVVFSAEDNEIYSQGEYMYGIGGSYVEDTTLPEIRDVSVSKIEDRPGFVQITAESSDATTSVPLMAFVATTETEEKTYFLNETGVAEEDGVSVFSGEAGPFSDSEITYKIVAWDESRNMAATDPVVIALAEPSQPSGDYTWIAVLGAAIAIGIGIAIVVLRRRS